MQTIFLGRKGDKNSGVVTPDTLIHDLFLRVLLLCYFTSSLSVVLKAQEQTTNYPVDKRPMSVVLEELSRTKGIKIQFNKEEVDRYKVATPIDPIEISVALDRVLQGTPFVYEIKNGIFIIVRTTFRRIKGKVFDEENLPLPGVSVREKHRNRGTVTDAQGNYSFDVPVNGTTLLYSYIGMKDEERVLEAGSQTEELKNVKMYESSMGVEEVVVTGVFDKPRESYTGAAATYTSKQLEAAGNRNMVASLRSLDPSFNIADNVSMGSNPNALPTITIRGQTALPTGVRDIQTDLRESNQPLFVLDGFEITFERFKDMDVTQVGSITILKDASATALYGSRGSNGVVVITTKPIKLGRLNVSYRGSVVLEFPDFSSYNLMNAAEKLEYERAADLYRSPGSTAEQRRELEQLYNQRKMDVERGVNTYWLKYPIRQFAVGSQHSLTVSGGSEEFKYSAVASYSNTRGVMIGSDRNVLNGSIFLQYRFKNFAFSNNLTMQTSAEENSPYGSFSQYTVLNSYHRPYDDDGNLLKLLENYTYPSLGRTNKVVNPLYNALLPSRSTSDVFTLTNNTAVDWTILQNLILRGKFSFTKGYSRGDIYKSAEHTSFDDYKPEDRNRKGTYTYSSGYNNNYDANLSLNYSKTFIEKHAIFLATAWTIRHATTESYSVLGEGLPVPEMDFLGLAGAYEKDGRPQGSESIDRAVGLVFSFQYTYDHRYFVDLSGKYDGSSRFGTKRRFIPIWSAGAGWNIHKEKFFSNVTTIDLLRLRTSYGLTASQNFAADLARRTYEFMGGDNSEGLTGVKMKSMGNPDLKWSITQQWNIGFDWGFFNNRLSGALNVYRKITVDMISAINLPITAGFDNYTANSGKVLNYGVDGSLTVDIIRKPRQDFRWSVGVNGAANFNQLLEVGDAIKKMNEQLAEANKTSPSFLYKEGQSMSTIYAVPSKGIDPSTGLEIFINKDGEETFVWKTQDQQPIALGTPILEGTINTNFRWKGFTMNMVFGYRFGGYQYNSTLASKVENVMPYDNLDRRVLYDRWKNPGDIAKFKSVKNLDPTNATSRFVFKDDTFFGTSISFGYDAPTEWIQKHLRMSQLSLTAYIDDLFWFSTIKRERGLDYPFSRRVSLTLSARF